MTSETTGVSTAGPLSVQAQVLSEVNFGETGLITAVVQDAHDGTVLMVAHMNEEALRRTLDSGRTWFWSRSRKQMWRKGDTSGAHQYVREIHLDCDGDAVVIKVDQHGEGACHTGEWTCFFRPLGEGPGVPKPDRSSHHD